MKRILGILTFCILIVGANAQSALETVETVNNNYPIMDFKAMEVDYGIIQQNAEPYREFKFTNVGNAPLVISNAKGSCGCTVPEWSKVPVAPGDSSIIKVKYATNRIGAFSKTITLTTNDEEGKHVLRIKGKVLKPEEADSNASDQ